MSVTDITDRLDPALRHLAGSRTNLSADGLDAYRESLNRRRRDAAQALDISGVAVEDTSAGAVPVRIYRGGSAVTAAVIYCHSGAFVLGNLDVDHRQCVELAKRGRCTVISMDYRLAPENPFPAALDDAAAVLHWAAANGARLCIDTDRLAAAGTSAGGALAARLAQRAGQGRAPRIVFQLLHQPVLDDRPTPSKQQFVSTPGFDSTAVALMWRHYLAGGHATADAAPARFTEISGLPPALITCSELDPLRDEALDYAVRLMRAGVPTELHTFPGTCHGFDAFVPEWKTSQQLYVLQGAALRTAFDRAAG
ncbi:alpha/beta hydrolase fold domain-containing protein [Mycobacterium sp. 1274761.0]|uniref:alpha/beta hydrolase fold domain-containing protein n=1 Tax=Mycobacterium sp. 1274761.0 TaxID=1834077 RepID=UPI000801FB31|nr:alpha/beta hydrolase fold domain-containing protein [Mycobacterium sp. 1274761.0]OBK72439.1 alpha/beta hydrolase [Mycobacterium sp. 1274761.0]